MKLVIFDLDQTLVDFIEVHDRATRELFQRCFGTDARLTEIDFAGRSLEDNFLDLAMLKGISRDTFERVGKEVLRNYDSVFCQGMPKYGVDYVLPGARRLLEALSMTDNLVVLYTGDSPRIVDCVFAATGLGKYFRFAVYGTEAESRVGMVGLALERADRQTGRKFRDKDIVIIGDSVRDIECGKHFNAVTIAVATGFHSEERLAKVEPDYLFRDLTDYERLLEAIG